MQRSATNQFSWKRRSHSAPIFLWLLFLVAFTTISSQAAISIKAGDSATIFLPPAGLGVSIDLVPDLMGAKKLSLTSWTSTPATGVTFENPEKAETKVTFSKNGRFWLTLRVEDSSGDTGSSSFPIHVNTKPYINVQPIPKTVTVGNTASFTVQASGYPIPTYQWFRDNKVIAGATSAAYTTLATTTGDNGAVFYVVASTPDGDIASQSASLTVEIIKPTFNQQPKDTSVTTGTTASFKVTAVGTGPLYYNWYRNDTLLVGTGTTSNTYNLTATDLLDGAKFHCIVNNGIYMDSIVSNKATLTVIIPPKPPVFTNTVWVATGTIGSPFSFQLSAKDGIVPYTFSATGLPAGLTIQSGTGLISGTPTAQLNAIASVTVTDASTPPLFSTHPLDISIGQSNSKPVFSLNPVNANVIEGDTAIFTVKASGVPNPTFVWEKNRTPILGQTLSTLKILTSSLDNGSSFRAIATNSVGQDTSTEASLNVRFRPTITQHPANVTALDGATATFSVKATGNPAPTYQWRRGGSPISNATNATYTTGKLIPQDSNALFNVAVFNGIGDTVYSTSAKLTIQLIDPSITAQPQNDTVNEGSSATFSVVATGSSLKYQWRRGGVNIPSNGNGMSYTLPIASMADSGIDFDCVITGTKQIITQKAYLSVKNVVIAPIITNSVLTFTTQINVLGSFPVTASGTTPTFSATGLPNGFSINTSTGLISGTPTQTGTTPVTIKATNAKGSDSKTLTVIVNSAPTAPTINSGSSYTGTIGIGISYTITASGSAPLTFSATGLPSPLTVNATTGLISGTLTTTGTYTIALKATNSVGSNSKNLVLTINPASTAPKFTTDLPDTLIRKEKQALILSVAASGVPAPIFQWEFINSQNQISQIGTGPTYRIDSVSLFSAGTYRVIANNGISPDAYSRSCKVTVNRLPVKPTFASQPISLMKLYIGQTDSISVRANATPPIYYQWKKNGIGPDNDITGENRATLSFKSASLSDSGKYYCMVWGSDVNWNDTNSYSFSAPSVLKVTNQNVDVPKTNYPDTTFTTGLSVTLKTDTTGTTIRYTLDGQTPNGQSQTYSQGSVLQISSTTTLKAIATKPGLGNSNVLTRYFTYQPPGKVALAIPAGDTLISAGGRQITLTATPTDAEVWYTLDGSDPIQNGARSTQYDPILKIYLFSSTTLKARAYKSNMLPSDIVTKRYVTESVIPKILPLKILPSNPRFYTNTGVILSTLTDSVNIWYTLDGSSPLTSATKTLSTGSFFISQTTTVKAIATRPNWDNSDSLTYTFYKIPGPIIVDPPGDTSFETKLTIRFFVTPASTPIFCTIDNTEPLDITLKPNFPIAFEIKEPLTVTTSTVLKCVAIGPEGIPSDTLTRIYTWSPPGAILPTPIAEPSSRSFQDTLRVSLRAGQSAVKIQYTTNGDDPDGPSSKTYEAPFLIDTTMTVRAMATLPGYSNSRFMVQSYTLVPDTPSASPSGGAVVGQALVTLSNRSKKVDIYYTLNGESPSLLNGTLYDGNPILIRSSASLKAIAVAGNVASGVLVANYTVIDTSTITLKPNEVFGIDNTPYTIEHSGDQPVVIRVGFVSTTDLKISGFADASFGFQVTPLWVPFTDTTQFPTLQFNKGAETRALFRIDSQGKVYFVSQASSVFLQSGGIYFLGRDTVLPKAEFVSESIGPGDSTEVVFLFTDNICNLTYLIDRSDIAHQNNILLSTLVPAKITTRLKSPYGEMRPLEISFTINDGTNTRRFPDKENQSFNLSQRLNEPFSVGKIFLGIKKARSWDLVSFPVNPTQNLTVGSFWGANPSFTKRLAISYQSSSKPNHIMKDDEPFLPGSGYWIAGNSTTTMVQLPSLTVTGIGAAPIQIPLKTGWNLIGNPVPFTLYWPIPRTLDGDYLNSKVKAPHAYSPQNDGYFHSDSLLPWRGYWVYSSTSDTIITLSQTQVVSRMALGRINSTRLVEFQCSLNGRQSIQMGAYAGANTNRGIEDEPAFPELDESQASLFALRNQSKLQTDWVEFKPGSLLTWQLGYRKPSETGDFQDENDEMAIQFTDLKLPSGYSAAVISKNRKIQYAVTSETRIPPPQSELDSLSIWVGPASLMKSALTGYTNGPPPFSRKMQQKLDGWNLLLDLPETTHIDWLVCNPMGQVLGEGHEYLSEGHQKVSVLKGTRSSGILFVRMVLRGKTLKIDQTFRLTSLPH